MNKTKQALRLTEVVINLLAKSALPSTLTIEKCAAKLNMSMTSFRRKLSQEEATFKLIQNKFLNELCVQELLTNKVAVENLAIKLGYSERATFERAFRKKFGITPSQFRKLALLDENNDAKQQLAYIAQHLPPMSDSCQQLLKAKEQDSLDLNKIVAIVEKDPIFTGRVIGLASKAIYGRTPKNLTEAIGRNLGVNTIVNLAVVYGFKDVLHENINKLVIEQYIQAFLLAPKIIQLLRKSIDYKVNFDISLTEQVLCFALLGIFLLSHKHIAKHGLMLYSLQGITDLDSLNKHISHAMGISIYSASAVMLSLWHIDAELIKKLNQLNKVSQQKTKATKEEELLLFMLSCLYMAGAGHNDYSALEQKAELLKINNFAAFEEMLF